MDIAQAMRAQLLGQFIDALSSGAAKGLAAATTAAPALPEKLSAGQLLTATVIAQPAEGRLAIRLQGQQIIADIGGSNLPPEARRPGAVLQLLVESAGVTPRLTFTGVTLPQQAQAAAGAPLPAVPAGVRDAEAPAQAAVRLVAAPAQRPAPPGGQPQAPPQQTPLQAAVRDAISSAAARQGSPAPLYANLAALVAPTASPLPQPVREIAQRLLALRIDASQPITPDAVRRAIATSGVLTEALVARQTPTLDAKTLLVALKALLPVDADPARNANRPELPAEPPRRESAPQALRPAPPTLPAEAEPKMIATALARETEQALERVKLHQFAALPEQRPAGPEGPRPQQLSFELPVALGQQTAMAGFKVERDRRRRREDGTPHDVWGIRFAIETDEIGAVHAHLRLAGPVLSVSLWADDPATRQAFADTVPLLEAALRDNALDVGEITVFAGRPHEPRGLSASGHFLDVSS